MRLLPWVFITLLIATPAVAQLNDSYYGFGGLGGATSTFNRSTALFHVGGGAEFTGNRGLGAGAELGYLGPWSNGSNGVGLLSINGLYRFSNSSFQPFVTGGYSLAFRSRSASFGNFGGGLISWFRPGAGLRLEVRDNIRDASTHWITVRVGVAFR